MVNKKYVLLIDLVLVIGSLFLISGFVGYTRPLVIAPFDDYENSNGSVLFSFEKADLILIDNNLEFSSPQEIYVENNLVVNLKPGIYYWKVVGALESDIRKFTIKSEIDLSLKEIENGNFEVVNSGNEKLDVDVYEKGKLTGKVVLDVDESKEVSGTKFIGGKNE